MDKCLSLLEKSQLALAVRQKRPKMMDDAAVFTLEVESYLTLPVSLNQQQVAAVSEVPQADNVPSVTSVAAIHTQQGETIIKMLSAFNTCLDQLENAVYKGNQHSQQRRNDAATNKHQDPLICRRCGKKGLFTRGCATGHQGN